VSVLPGDVLLASEGVRAYFDPPHLWGLPLSDAWRLHAALASGTTTLTMAGWLTLFRSPHAVLAIEWAYSRENFCASPWPTCAIFLICSASEVMLR
jgi:hypothetical protein